MNNLTQQCITLSAQLAEQVPADTLAAFQRAIIELQEMDLAERSLAIGERFPKVSLYQTDGQVSSVKELADGGTVVVAFLRGSWCPYCNLEVRALEEWVQQMPNVKLLAVSPQTADAQVQWQEQQGLHFTLLTDRDNTLARALGIAFELPEFVRKHYTELGIDLPQINQTDDFALPIPAVYVLDGNGIIIYKFVEADYTKRVDLALLKSYVS